MCVGGGGGGGEEGGGGQITKSVNLGARAKNEEEKQDFTIKTNKQTKITWVSDRFFFAAAIDVFLRSYYGCN